MKPQLNHESPQIPWQEVGTHFYAKKQMLVHSEYFNFIIEPKSLRKPNVIALLSDIFAK